MTREFIIGGLDIETTGLLDPEHRIIEACLITTVLRGNRLEEVNSYVQRIDPKRSIDAAAEAVHKISAADLVGEPTWEVVAPTLLAKLNECDYVMAHNGDAFDYMFIAQELERINLELPNVITIDTMLEGRWATDMGAVPSLKALCFACGEVYDENLAHSAEYDVRRMLACYEFGLKRGVYKLPEIPQESL